MVLASAVHQGGEVPEGELWLYVGGLFGWIQDTFVSNVALLQLRRATTPPQQRVIPF